MLNNNSYIDPIASVSNDQYYSLDSYLIHPQYLSPPSTHHHQSLCFHSVYFQSDLFDDIDQEHQIHLLLQNHLHSHDNSNNNLQQHHHHRSKPPFRRESADEITSAVPVLPESTSPYNPTITTSGNLAKGKSPAPNHDDHHQQQLLISSENLGGKKPVPPADHHHHLYVEPLNMPRKRGSSSGRGSCNGKNKKRKDRHSKILITATTRPRHRRMRLSIDVAREFFDLQDMLGVERASKTVEWLLIKAKPDIDKLRELNNRGSYSTSTSTSSGLDEEGMNGSGEAAGSGTCSKQAGIKEKEKKYTRSKSSKRVVINPLAKEQRERARERARERTREKKINNKRVEMRINNNINLSSSSLDQSVLHLVSSCDHEHDHHHYRHHQHYDDQFAQEPSLIVANTNGWNNLQTSTSTSAAFLDDESCNSNLVTNIGNLWNPSLVATNSLNNVVSAAATTTSATAAFGIPQQHQFSFFGKGWEGCSSQSLGFPET